MMIFVDDNNAILSVMTVGGVGGIEVEDVPQEVIDNPSNWLFIDGEFIIKTIEPNINEIKAEKIKELSDTCEQVIVNGVDIGNKHYSMSLTDQLNLESLKTSIMTGMTAVPYHADTESCSLYSADDFLVVYKACAGWKIGQTTYFNQLREYVNSLENADEINAVIYGQELTGEYLEAYNEIMGILNETVS